MGSRVKALYYNALGIEGFFREAGPPATHDGPAPPVDSAEIARTEIAVKRYGLDINFICATHNIHTVINLFYHTTISSLFGSSHEASVILSPSTSLSRYRKPNDPKSLARGY